MSKDTAFLWYELFQTKSPIIKNPDVLRKINSNPKLLVDKALEMSNSELKSISRKVELSRFNKSSRTATQIPNHVALYREYEELTRNRIEIIYPGHNSYPERLLKFIQHNVPSVLFCKGRPSLLTCCSVSIVGSRNASSEGLKISEEFAGALAMHRVNVVSGYAKGIDTSAHLRALRNGGTTSIVLSEGILQFRIKRVFEGLKWEGHTLIVSQFHPKDTWKPRNAMIRNKLICALSEAVIIIESAQEKDTSGRMRGTFACGKTALKMGIPLFVVSPSAFRIAPVGNIDLIGRGGLEIDLKNGIKKIINYLKANRTQNQVIRPG